MTRITHRSAPGTACKTASPTKRNYVKPKLILLAGTHSEGKGPKGAGTPNAKSDDGVESVTSTNTNGVTIWYGPS